MDVVVLIGCLVVAGLLILEDVLMELAKGWSRGRRRGPRDNGGGSA